MDYLNLVFSALTLLATVTLGVIQITWIIARDVFRDKHKARHDSWDKKVTTASRSPTRAVVAFSNNVLVRS